MIILRQSSIVSELFPKLVFLGEIMKNLESIENDVEGADDIMAMSPGHFKRKNSLK